MLKDRSLAVIAFAALEKEGGFSILRELIGPMFRGVVLHRPALFPEISLENHTSESNGWLELERVFYLRKLPARKSDVGWRIIKLGDLHKESPEPWDDSVVLPLSRIEGEYLYQFSNQFADRMLMTIHERYGSQVFIHLKDELHDVLEWLGRLDKDMLARPDRRPLFS